MLDEWIVNSWQTWNIFLQLGIWTSKENIRSCSRESTLCPTIIWWTSESSSSWWQNSRITVKHCKCKWSYTQKHPTTLESITPYNLYSVIGSFVVLLDCRYYFHTKVQISLEYTIKNHKNLQLIILNYKFLFCSFTKEFYIWSMLQNLLFSQLLLLNKNQFLSETK